MLRHWCPCHCCHYITLVLFLAQLFHTHGKFMMFVMASGVVHTVKWTTASYEFLGKIVWQRCYTTGHGSKILLTIRVGYVRDSAVDDCVLWWWWRVQHCWILVDWVLFFFLLPKRNKRNIRTFERTRFVSRRLATWELAMSSPGTCLFIMRNLCQQHSHRIFVSS